MRIIGGEFKGRKIRTCEGPGYRPATGRVRESVFSMLSSRGVDWHGIRVVDMFAGSGSLAIECLSRGAQEALFVEKNGKAAALIQSNLKDLGVSPKKGRVLRQDLFKVLAKAPEKPFDLGFIDPPYGKDFLLPALEKVLENRWIAEGGLLLAEVEVAICPPFEGPVGELELLVDKEYGQTRILIWRI